MTQRKIMTMQELYNLYKHLGAGEIVLDVRTPEEFAEAHVPGAINIDHEDVGRHAEKLKKYKTVYIHCRSGKRSLIAYDDLAAAGLNNLVCVTGSGMMDWLEAGYETES